MRRSFVAVVAALLMGALMFPTAAGAKNNKVDVCHSEGNGTYHLINIAENTVQKHIDNHGDGLPGDAVPGMEDLNFSADCVPVDITLAMSGCFDFSLLGTTQYVMTDGSDIQPVLTFNPFINRLYSDAACTTNVNSSGVWIVWAADLAEAQDLCNGGFVFSPETATPNLYFAISCNPLP